MQRPWSIFSVEVSPFLCQVDTKLTSTDVKRTGREAALADKVMSPSKVMFPTNYLTTEWFSKL